MKRVEGPFPLTHLRVVDGAGVGAAHTAIALCLLTLTAQIEGIHLRAGSGSGRYRGSSRGSIPGCTDVVRNGE